MPHTEALAIFLSSQTVSCSWLLQNYMSMNHLHPLHFKLANAEIPTWLNVSLLTLLILNGCHSVGAKKRTDADVLACRQQCQLGLDAIERGELSSAVDHFGDAVQACPTNERARRCLADSLWKSGNQDQALSQMHQAIHLASHDPETRIRLGQMHLFRGDVHEASRHSRVAIAQNPNSPEAWALRGDINRRLGNLEDALSDYHRSLSLRPHYPEIQIALAWLYFHQNRPAAALAVAQNMAEPMVETGLPQDLLLLEGVCYKALGRFDEAVNRLDEALLVGPSSPDLFFQIAQLRWKQGQTEQAEQAVHSALAIDATHSSSLNLLAHIQQQQQRIAVRQTSNNTPPDRQ